MSLGRDHHAKMPRLPPASWAQVTFAYFQVSRDSHICRAMAPPLDDASFRGDIATMEGLKRYFPSRFYFSRRHDSREGWCSRATPGRATFSDIQHETILAHYGQAMAVLSSRWYFHI